MSIGLSVSSINIDVQGHLSAVNSDSFWTYAAVEWHRLYNPFVPYKTGMLQNTVHIEPKQIEHTVPYARYQYGGEVYAPSYPIMQHGRVVSFFSPEKKHPTGRSLVYSTALHPSATKEWDKAAAPTRKPLLVRSLQAYIDSGRLQL